MVPKPKLSGLDLSSNHRKGIRLQRSGAIPNFIDRHTCLIENSHQQVGHRSVVRVLKVIPGLQLSAESSGKQARQVEMPVQIAIAHSAAVENQAVIQEGTVAVGSGFET